MQVEITRLNDNGEGIAKMNEKIIFIPKTIPGDIVELTNIENHKNFSRASLKKIIKKSKNRIPIDCPYYQTCGGCHLMGLSYEKQLEYKKEKVKNILKKYAKLEVEPTIKESEPYNYRNKITLQVQNGIIGLYESNSNTLVKITKCLLISDQMNQVINQLQSTINLQKIEKIMIREVSHQIMVQLIGQTEEKFKVKELSKTVASLYLNDKKLYGLTSLKERLGPYKFLVSKSSFFQVNHNQTINLYNQVKKYLGNNHNHVLDLYCGTGTIGIYVSSCCKKITGIELNHSSVIDARNNIKINHLQNIEILEGDVGKLLQAKNTYDAIIVDPPRSGLDKKTRQTLLTIKSPKIIYISCNPMTLARDLNQLKQLYNLEAISLFDMFPNTYHVETVCVLERK